MLLESTRPAGGRHLCYYLRCGRQREDFQPPFLQSFSSSLLAIDQSDNTGHRATGSLYGICGTECRAPCGDDVLDDGDMVPGLKWPLD